MAKLVLLRHGQSKWNEKNLFTGWVDVPLSTKGIQEALHAGDLLKKLPIDTIFTSTLIRAQMTAMIAMSCHEAGKIPVFQHKDNPQLSSWETIFDENTKKETIPTFIHWELNERMYGQLQGCDKESMRKKYSPEQVHIWRRSFDVPPPEGESLEMTAKRTIPFFQKTILPQLESGSNILICAHGNSLRSIVMSIENLSKEDVLSLEIPTGEPFGYSYEKGKLTKLSSLT